MNGDEDEIDHMTQPVEQTLEELIGLGLVEAFPDPHSGQTRYRVTGRGKEAVEVQIDDCLEQAVSILAHSLSLPKWMAREMLFARAAYLRDLDR